MIHRNIAQGIANHILPTKHNGFLPRVLRDWSIGTLLIVSVALFSFSQIARFTGTFGLSADVLPAVVATLTNDVRTKNSLTPLSVSDVLTRAATLKANDMAANGYFAHTSPTGLTPWHWFGEVGYTFIYAGENLAINFNDSNTVEQAWLNSPTHRANILSPNFTQIGIATATGTYNGKTTTFVVEMFGMPATTAPKSTPVATAPTATTTHAPTPVTTEQPKTESSSVAGESTTSAGNTLHTIAETTAFAEVQNTDPALVPTDVQATPTTSIPWYKRALLQSTSFVGVVFDIIIIVLFFATAGVVASEYRKHHRTHMAYGILMMVIIFSFLFIGRLGFFKNLQPLASAGQQEYNIPI
jgi:hypothetical protein